jgi:hypothetical protein
VPKKLVQARKLTLLHRSLCCAITSSRISNIVTFVVTDAQASSSGAVPKELVKALKRRKMYARKGGRKGEGEPWLCSGEVELHVGRLPS